MLKLELVIVEIVQSDDQEQDVRHISLIGD